jgi:eukaryotic-like serine/threonine-protein kinase
MIDPDDLPQNLKLLALLGQGGMGSVWIAKHLGLQTRVAVKFLSADIGGSKEVAVRFQREAVAAAQIQSPHVVQVFDHGLSKSGVPYIVMELLDGEDLEHRIARDGPMTPQQVSTIMTQVARALSRAHDRGIIHRDIKPENVFLLSGYDDLFVKVLDFGIAKRVTLEAGLTATGTMIGTPAYASPEQIQSAKDVDFGTDLWSVAVTAYEALTGRLPFEAPNLVHLVLAVQKGDFLPPSRHRPELPPSVDAWFERALARNPKARFRSATELAETFARAISGTVPTAANIAKSTAAVVDSAPANPGEFDKTLVDPSRSGEVPVQALSRRERSRPAGMATTVAVAIAAIVVAIGIGVAIGTTLR